jgi:putative Ca2+/H+ antiporter (TMEM165/GDT1 family)
VLKLKKGDGCLKGVRLLHEKTNYTMILGSCVAAIAVQLLAVVAGSAVAYYLLYAMAAWLFALLVYYTVKML